MITVPFTARHRLYSTYASILVTHRSHLSVNLCDAFLIPVRVVRRPARTKASAPRRPGSLGARAAPSPPRLPRFALQADEGFSAASSICGLCKLMEGSGGRESPPAAGGGPQPGTDRRCATRPRPQYGAGGAGQDLKALRTGTRLRRNPPRLEKTSGTRTRHFTNPLQAATNVTDRRPGTEGSASS